MAKHKGNQGGKPTTYTTKVADALNQYVDDTIGKKRLPHVQEFCYQQKPRIARTTLYDWLDAKNGDVFAHPELRDAHENLMAMQEMMLIELGVSGKAGTAMCIFLLKTRHGHIETEKIQHVGGDDEPLTLIFTDSATFKAHEANKAKNAQT